MAYATITEYDVDMDTHMRMGEAVGEAPVAGMILHLAGPSDRGVYSLDIWESKEDANRFWTERMLPALQKMGFEGDGQPPLSFQQFDLPFVLGR